MNSKLRALMFAVTTLAIAGPVQGQSAEPPPVVVELFTSQGCSSCPPADALIHAMAARKDLIVLSLPVDYWDYLGWKDTLASPANTRRQRAYAYARGDGEVYTPQVVSGGRFHAVGSNKASVEEAIARARRTLAEHPVDITVTGAGPDQSISIAKSSTPMSKPSTLVLVSVKTETSVAIGRGENRGATVLYTNAVRDWKVLAQWRGEALSLKLPADAQAPAAKLRHAVLLQDGEAGPIVAARWVD